MARQNRQDHRAKSKRPTQLEKRELAFRTYLDLLDTADWIRGFMRGPLESFDLTMGGFRLLEMLYRDGPVSMPEAAERMQCARQNTDVIFDRLEERGWVAREIWEFPPVDSKENLRRLRNVPRKEKRGRRIGMAVLTPQGKKFIAIVFSSHAKVVKALMRAIDGRERVSLSRICRKLREGDALRFRSEMIHEDVDADE
jgi:DNA-binding MarR family transcriptional regulator